MIPGTDKEHPSFWESFGFAIEGFAAAVKGERNIKVMLALGAAALVAGAVLGIDALSWCIVLLCCGIVIHGELVNTAIEALVDLVSPEWHPLAKRAKDIAAASVYVLSFTAAVVGLIVYARALGLL